jgi:outer membrane protein assembly factor BamB
VGIVSGLPGITTVTAEVVDLDDPDAGWRGLVGVVVQDQPLPPAMTLGTARLYQAGVGTMLPPTSSGNGVRAFPVATAPPSCGLGPAPDLLCPAWATPVDGEMATSPVLGEGETTVYVGTDAGTLYALDAATGAVEWTAAVGAGIVDPPALADGKLYVPTGDGDLVVLAAGGCGAATCSPLWQGATGSPIRVQPAVAGGVVFTGSADGTVAAFDAAGCGAAACPSLWDADAGGAVSGAPAVSGGRLYVGAGADLVAFALP